jgi:hypothetical protein
VVWAPEVAGGAKEPGNPAGRPRAKLRGISEGLGREISGGETDKGRLKEWRTFIQPPDGVVRGPPTELSKRP